jgi:hypothetical protein
MPPFEFPQIAKKSGLKFPSQVPIRGVRMEMDHEEQTHFVKRVVLPSGKTIEVVYFKDAVGTVVPEEQISRPAEPDQDLHLCLDCGSDLVYPVEWEEAGPTNWTVLLHCPNCAIYREGVFSQDCVEQFDEELDRGADALARDYRRLMRANMAEEIDRFVGALESDAILPEDF